MKSTITIGFRIFLVSLALASLGTDRLQAEQFGPFYYNITGTNSVEITGYTASDDVTEIEIPDEIEDRAVTRIAPSAFRYHNELSKVAIPFSVTSIGERAFEYCSGLTRITLSPNLTQIADRVFQGCTALANVSIPDSVYSIREYAFSGCSALTSVSIPDSVNSIRDNAFAGCIALGSVLGIPRESALCQHRWRALRRREDLHPPLPPREARRFHHPRKRHLDPRSRLRGMLAVDRCLPS